MVTDSKITTQNIIAKLLEISSTAFENTITKLKLRGLLKRIGPDNDIDGYYEARASK